MGNSHKNHTWIKAAFNSNATALWRPSWWESTTAGHNFGKGPSNDLKGTRGLKVSKSVFSFFVCRTFIFQQFFFFMLFIKFIV
jgi:hypothetical protein